MGQPAARISDMHACPMFDGPKPHVGGPIIPVCMVNVLTGGLPQARVSDMAMCAGPPDMIVKGSLTVLVGGLPAARMGDNCAHGGVIVAGMPTVLIGDAPGAGGVAGGGGGMPGNPPAGGPGGIATGAATGTVSQALPLPVEGSSGDLDRMAETLIVASENGVPFCEQCAKGR
jgi:uncharacterized Zn-binding protein involved in type VI secretion